MDNLHANYFIYNLFGPNENRRHNKFKALFAFQKHLIEPPLKKNSKLEGAASSYVDLVYISTRLNHWCRLFRR